MHHQRSKQSTNKAVKTNNEPIIYAQWDISQPIPLSLQTAELCRVCLLLLMLMMMMGAMVARTPTTPIPSTQACSSAPASTQTEYIFTPRYRCLSVWLCIFDHRLSSWGTRDFFLACFPNNSCSSQGCAITGNVSTARIVHLCQRITLSLNASQCLTHSEIQSFFVFCHSVLHTLSLFWVL